MKSTEQISEWVRHYEAATMKFNALRAVLENDGERMLVPVLKRLGLASALDVIKACDDCYVPRK